MLALNEKANGGLFATASSLAEIITDMFACHQFE